MSKDWKTDRAEAAIKEGTDKIMKAAQEKAKQEKVETTEQIVEVLDYEVNAEPGSFEVCLGVGMNQLFPEYIAIDLKDDDK